MLQGGVAAGKECFLGYASCKEGQLPLTVSKVESNIGSPHSSENFGERNVFPGKQNENKESFFFFLL